MSPPPPAVAPPPSPVRMIATLALAGLGSGLGIVGAYELTLPMITANKAEALRLAVFDVVPGATRMQPLAFEGKLDLAADPSADGVIYGAYDEGGAFLGYAVPTEGPGFQDTIRLIYGLDPAGKQLTGMGVLESRETPGLGDGIYKKPWFVDQWRTLVIEPRLELVGQGKKTAPHQVEAITGATISSKAVTGIVNKSLETWVERVHATPEPPAWHPPAEEGQ